MLSNEFAACEANLGSWRPKKIQNKKGIIRKNPCLVRSHGVLWSLVESLGVSWSLVESRENVRDSHSHETNFNEIIAALTIK